MRYGRARRDDPTESTSNVRETFELDDPSLTIDSSTKRIVFAIMAISMFMASIDLAIVATALPSIGHDFRSPINWTGWTITIYGLGIIIALPLAGRLSDQLGRRRVFLYGVTLFTVSSLLCGTSADIVMLIVFRATQAIGGGAIQPTAAGLIADHFGRDRDRAIGMIGTFTAAGQLIGPILGGFIVTWLSWRWIFFVNIPIGLLLLFLMFKFIPDSRTRSTSKIDVRGLALMATFLTLAMIGLSLLGDQGTYLDSPSFVALELGAVLGAVLFVRHSQRTSAPFIPLRFLHGRGFAALNTENVLFGYVGFGTASLVPLYAEQRYGLKVLSAGTLLTARAIGMIAIGAVTAFALRRIGNRVPMAVGFSLMAIGLAAMSISPRWGIGPYAWLSISSGIVGLGTGATIAPARNALLKLAPNDVGTVSGLCSMFIFLGTILSVSIVTTILARSSNPGMMQSHVLAVTALVIAFVMLPLVARVPKGKGVW
jgi:EmrB/QacA subfamily drug resistance transporter